MKEKFFQKGFIGPIGDDLPSLIPLVISLLLFFSIFSMTLNTYNTQNLLIQKQIEMTSAAREIKGDSLILNVDDFQKNCRILSAESFPYNFMVSVYSADSSLKSTIEDFAALEQDKATVLPPESGILRAPSLADLANPTDFQNYFCRYQRVGSSNFIDSKTGKPPKDYMIRYYPVAVQQPVVNMASGNATPEDYLIIPGVMAMVVWE